MQAALTVFVILIFLLIIALEKIELRISSCGRLKIQLTSTLFTLELKNFSSKKKDKKRGSFSSALSSLKFLIKHSELFFDDASISVCAPYFAIGAASAIFSALFAYCGSISDKISLPRETGICNEAFTFDVKLKARRCIFLSAFIIYKIKSIGRRSKVSRNVG